MQPPETKSVGILPIGALGVAFYHHLTAGGVRPPGEVVFISRRSASADPRWREDLSVTVETKTGRQNLALVGRLVGSLPEAAAQGRLPKMILVCTNPDQLFDVIADYVAVVEIEFREGRLPRGAAGLPLLILCANGIYFQRIRSSFIELLEESTLLGRLPDLWPEHMPAIVGRLMRGVTIQTASRCGAGSSAVYRPGPPGRTQLTGGDRQARAAAVLQLNQGEGWFEDAAALQPTRVEFNKALVNLATNLLDQLAAIDDHGRFRALTVAEITRLVPDGEVFELVEAVMKVGRGVGIFGAHESPSAVYDNLRNLLESTQAHVPSGLQWIQQQKGAGTLGPGLAPTEKWLLQPLQQFARSLGDPTVMKYFEDLEQKVAAAIDRAIAAGRTS